MRNTNGWYRIEHRQPPTIRAGKVSASELMRRAILMIHPQTDECFYVPGNKAVYFAAKQLGAKVRTWKDPKGRGYCVWRVA